MAEQRRLVITWQKGYVASGLVARYLGSNNTGSGHSTTTTVWKNLVGSADMVLSTSLRAGTRQWGANYFESLRVSVSAFSWLSGNLPPEFTPENSTIQVVFMPYVGADAGNGGDVVGLDNVATNPYTTIALQMGALNAQTIFQETSNFTISNTRALTANLVYSVTLVATPYSAIPARNGRKKIYYNEILFYDQARTANFFIQLPSHYISASGNPGILSTNQNFYGRIYEIRLYNRMLTPAEIARNVALDRANYGITT